MDPRVGRGSGWPRFDGHCCRTLAHSGARLFTGIRFEHRRSLRFGDEFRGRRGGGRRSAARPRSPIASVTLRRSNFGHIFLKRPFEG
jgi:hypothetical protein